MNLLFIAIPAVFLSLGFMFYGIRDEDVTMAILGAIGVVVGGIFCLMTLAMPSSSDYLKVVNEQKTHIEVVSHDYPDFVGRIGEKNYKCTVDFDARVVTCSGIGV